jgi:hypothetical protein
MMALSTFPTPPAEALRQSLLANREQALTQLYERAFPQVRRHVCRRGGSVQDAQDVFHDALVLLYEQAVGGTLVLTAAPSTYLVGISRNLWHHEQRRRARLPHEDLPDYLDQLPADATEPAESDLVLLDYVEQPARSASACYWLSTISSSRWAKSRLRLATVACARLPCKSLSAWSDCASRYEPRSLLKSFTTKPCALSLNASS